MRLLKYIFGFFLLTSCGHGYELSELYSQEIENSDKTIIDFSAWSTWNDSNENGTTILDKNESKDIMEAEQMLSGFFIGKPTKDTIFVIELLDGGTNIPKYVYAEITKFNGLNVKTYFYLFKSPKYGSTEQLTFKFSSFRETNDSLIFGGLENHYSSLQNEKNEIGFLKGNIKIDESNSLKGIVKEITVPAFVQRNLANSLIDKITILGNDSLYFQGLAYFTFEPTRQIKSSEFTNFGIYKERKIRNVKNIQ